ncbi:MAG TPA: penicillin-binding transpeptidase domain-containing protein [Clostridia bacterium]|nr:penicillin-binding transpeptidase domain-containing protein [Clostridia bacterium]
MGTPGVLNKKRLFAALIIMGCIYLLLIGRLAGIQLFQGDELEERAESQQTKDTTLSAARGMILDATGVVLARNGTAYKVVLWPNSIKAAERERVATELAKLLGLDYARVLAKVSDTSKQEIILARQVERETVETIDALKLGKGVGTAIDTKRYYTNGRLFSQLLGFTTVDGVGQAGLEQKLNEYLAGKDGEMITETDRKGNPLAYGVQEIIPATDGYDVTLTVNAVIQGMLEKACAEALAVNKAVAVQGIIMNCKTGELLALTTQPDLDPNEPPRDDMDLLNSLMRNRVATDAYEPGSTFKLVTLASALDSHTVTTGSGFYCPGYVYIGGDRIRCWKSGGHGSISLMQAVESSCNVAFVNMAVAMGAETFYDYIYSFGFGSTTNSGIPGESGGIVMNQKYVKDATLARIGFGQSIAVTPLQLCTAVCAEINGGLLMQPYIVDRVTATDGTLIVDNDPVVIRRVISEETSALIREIGEQVVKSGSGKNAAIPGYRVGGKTGTAQKYGEDGKIAQGKLIASFIGFAPADDPQFVCLILVDEPQVGTIFGSTVAAPFVKQVLEETLRYAGYLPEGGDESVTVPDLTGMTVREAKDALEEIGLEATFQSGDSESVFTQVPAAGSTVMKGSNVLIYTEVMELDADTDDGYSKVKVPDVSGMTRLEAHDALEERGLRILIDPPDQQGKAIRQFPEAGVEVDPGTEVLVEFSDTNIGG